MKVLVTGGSGFIAAHCVDSLLQNGHDVVFTVRSEEKGKTILANHANQPSSKLSFVIVKDIAQEHAFDEAVKSDPPFDAVLHTASPFHFHPVDMKKDLVDPAIIGTTGILRSIKQFAPSVKMVVLTSSFAAMMQPSDPKIYDESCWNPVKLEQATEAANIAYRVGKTYAEKAAWEFVEKEKPNFQLATMLPTLVMGPSVHYLTSLDSLNTSNQRLRDMMQGKMKDALAPTGYYLWVDVRDVALAHVRAMERPETAAGKRFFLAQGYMTNAEIADAIKASFPQYANNFPAKYESDLPKDIYDFSNKRTREILGIEYTPLDKCVVDAVKSLEPLLQ